jgi:transcription elongation factor GreA
MHQTPLTPAGYQRLAEELQRLKQLLPNLIQDLSTARSHGDLKENAEYHAAKERRALIDQRIQALESLLASSTIIDVMTLMPTGRVVFGVTVTLRASYDNSIVTYVLVGSEEADITQGRLSITAPLGKALLGRIKGDTITMDDTIYTIVEVAYVATV